METVDGLVAVESTRSGEFDQCLVGAADCAAECILYGNSRFKPNSLKINC